MQGDIFCPVCGERHNILKEINVVTKAGCQISIKAYECEKCKTVYICQDAREKLPTSIEESLDIANAWTIEENQRPAKNVDDLFSNIYLYAITHHIDMKSVFDTCDARIKILETGASFGAFESSVMYLEMISQELVCPTSVLVLHDDDFRRRIIYSWIDEFKEEYSDFDVDFQAGRKGITIYNYNVIQKRVPPRSQLKEKISTDAYDALEISKFEYDNGESIYSVYLSPGYLDETSFFCRRGAYLWEEKTGKLQEYVDWFIETNRVDIETKLNDEGISKEEYYGTLYSGLGNNLSNVKDTYDSSYNKENLVDIQNADNHFAQAGSSAGKVEDSQKEPSTKEGDSKDPEYVDSEPTKIYISRKGSRCPVCGSPTSLSKRIKAVTLNHTIKKIYVHQCAECAAYFLTKKKLNNSEFYLVPKTYNERPFKPTKQSNYSTPLSRPESYKNARIYDINTSDRGSFVYDSNGFMVPSTSYFDNDDD